jgi:ATP-dependent DNA helicase RecQ
LATIHEILKRYWGFTQFRPLQEDIINSLLDAKDTLALLPTGGGKSMCFQVPGMFLDGTCLVISPLIALMQDQVNQLKNRGIWAEAITSALSKNEIENIMNNVANNKIKFLYVSPERLIQESFIAQLKNAKISFVAVDEAHCISQWGYDFRPPYLEIGKIRHQLGKQPIIALTASATPLVKKDIQEKLLFKNENQFQRSFERKNLQYVVINTFEKLAKLVEILQKVNGTAIVYVASRKETKRIAQWLIENNIQASFYHAGLTANERSKRQQDWINDKLRVMVCTNAFGMGIDKPNVRVVIHMEAPASLEAYYQEAGRAGRDEKNAYVVVLFNLLDTEKLSENLKLNYPNIDAVKNIYQSIANFLNIPIPSDENYWYDFDMELFCKNFNLKAFDVLKSIKRLEHENLVMYTDAIFIQPKIMFTANKAIIYKFEVENKILEPLIKYLLRRYEGLFDNYTEINLMQIALDNNVNEEKLLQWFKYLKQNMIIDFIPSKTKPMLQLVGGRQKSEYLRFDLQKQKFLYQQEELRITAITNYCNNKNLCRQLLILNYFGEITTKTCGRCDICLKRNKLSLTQHQIEAVLNNILVNFHKKPFTLVQLKTALPSLTTEIIEKCIKWLQDEEEITANNDTWQLTNKDNQV